MNWFKRLFSRRLQVVQLPSLLITAPLEDELLAKVIKLHFKHQGVQALIQAVETEAAWWQAASIDENAPTAEQRARYAGGASALLRVLSELAKISQGH